MITWRHLGFNRTARGKRIKQSARGVLNVTPEPLAVGHMGRPTTVCTRNMSSIIEFTNGVTWCPRVLDNKILNMWSFTEGSPKRILPDTHLWSDRNWYSSSGSNKGNNCINCLMEGPRTITPTERLKRTLMSQEMRRPRIWILRQLRTRKIWDLILLTRRWESFPYVYPHMTKPFSAVTTEQISAFDENRRTIEQTGT